MKADIGEDPRREAQIRPLGAEAADLATALRSSPYLDASFLTALADRDLVRDLNGREAWTSWIGEEAQGFLILDPGPDAVAELTLAVLPGARRRGIGRGLVDFAMERGQTEGWTCLSLLVQSGNEGAIRFFEALGFVEGHTQLRGYRCLRRSLLA